MISIICGKVHREEGEIQKQKNQTKNEDHNNFK